MHIEPGDPLFEAIAEKVSEQYAKMNPARRTKPYTVRDAAEVLPWSERTIRDKIAANIIRTVDGMTPYLIPASEIERLTK